MNKTEKLQAKVWLDKIETLTSELYDISNKECHCLDKLKLCQEIRKRIFGLRQLVLK